MRKRPVLCQTHALAIILCFFGQSIFGQPRSITEAQLVLSGGTIYVSPTENPVRDGVVVVRDGKIAAVGRRGSIQIPSGAQILDCSGLTIISGFWNSHVHFMERKWADAAKNPAAAKGISAMLTQTGSRADRYRVDVGKPAAASRPLSPAKYMVRKSARRVRFCTRRALSVARRRIDGCLGIHEGPSLRRSRMLPLRWELRRSYSMQEPMGSSCMR